MTEEAAAKKEFMKAFFQARKALRSWLQIEKNARIKLDQINRKIRIWGKREELLQKIPKRNAEYLVNKCREYVSLCREHLATMARYYDSVTKHQQPNLNELSEMLGMSEQALKSFIAKNDVPEKDWDLTKLAFAYRAEPEESEILFFALFKQFIQAVDEHPELQYMMDQKLHELVPEAFPKPIPPQPPKHKRHLHAVH